MEDARVPLSSSSRSRNTREGRDHPLLNANARVMLPWPKCSAEEKSSQCSLLRSCSVTGREGPWPGMGHYPRLPTTAPIQTSSFRSGYRESNEHNWPRDWLISTLAHGLGLHDQLADWFMTMGLVVDS